MKLYRPFDGSDIANFRDTFCRKCLYYANVNNKYSLKICPIIELAGLYKTDHQNYPNQWRYDSISNKPTCIAFSMRTEV